MILTEALQVVVDELDLRMSDNPNRQLADTCNYLQAMLEDLDGGDDE